MGCQGLRLGGERRLLMTNPRLLTSADRAERSKQQSLDRGCMRRCALKQYTKDMHRAGGANGGGI